MRCGAIARCCTSLQISRSCCGIATEPTREGHLRREVSRSRLISIGANAASFSVQISGCRVNCGRLSRGLSASKDCG